MPDLQHDVKYYAILGDEQAGPFTLDELVKAGVLPDTYIWCKGMKQWEKARDNGDVCRYFRQSLSEAMHPTVKYPVSPEDATEQSAVIPRYQYMIDQSGETPDWLENTPEDMSVPPRFFILESILAALVCFPITGIIALVFGIMSKRAWKKGDTHESYDLSRRARMTLGITIFAGLIVWGVAMFP